MPEILKCPPEIAARLLSVGGINRFGGPMYRVVWGFDRIVKLHGAWGLHGDLGVQTREEPKYLPGDRWHLEQWRPPEDYGTPEEWRKAGEEWNGPELVNTAGEYPSRGEYELCFTLSSNGGPDGDYIPLDAYTVTLLVWAVERSRAFHMPLKLREANIRQRLFRERQQRVELLCEELVEAKPAFWDTPTSLPWGPKIHTKLQ